MIPVLIPIGLVAVVAGLGYLLNLPLKRQGYRMWRRPPYRPFVHTFDPRASTFRGGSRIGPGNASYPLAKLTVDHDVARITGSLTGSTWVARQEVLAVQPVRGLLGGGVRFQTADGSFDGVIFWTFDRATVLAAFAWWGWPVAP